MTNLPLDTRIFAESLKILFKENVARHERLSSRIKSRYRDLETQISQCSEIAKLQRLHDAQKFYEEVAETLDVNLETLRYASRQFEAIDPVYWKMVMDGARLLQENEFLKHTVKVLLDRDDKALATMKERRWCNDRIVTCAA